MPSASDIYNIALQQQTSLYNSTKSGYAQLMQQQRADQANVVAGYNTLSGNVQGLIGDIGRAQATRLTDQYTQASGQAAQDLTSRGLGNTTVNSSVQRGLGLDKAKADVELQNAIANTQASYLSNIGLAGLGAQGQFVGQNAQLGSNALNALQNYSGSFASLYGGLAQQSNWEKQFAYQQNQDAMNRVYGAALGAASQSSANAARSAAMTQQGNQFGQKLGLDYAQLGQQGSQFDAQLGQQGQIAGANMGLQYAQLGQQQNQFNSNLNLAYDRYAGGYGAGAPTAYSGRLPTNQPYQYGATGSGSSSSRSKS